MMSVIKSLDTFLSRILNVIGFPHPMIGPDKDLSEISKSGVSNYGPDLLKKMPKMRRLLGVEP